MRSDKKQVVSKMSPRTIITAVALVLVVIFLIYQVYGLIGGGGSAPTPPPKTVKPMAAASPMMQPQPALITPQHASLPKQQPVSQREIELMQMQQQMEVKYIQVVNELQMLKLSREIAETNQAIVAAKLATITAQKNILNLLRPAPPEVQPAPYRVITPTATPTAQPKTSPPISPIQPEVNYSVISVSKLQNRWSAVIGYQNDLYHVSVGDILPPDQSKVLTINKSGIMLEKNGVKRLISMVPMI